MIKLLDAHFNLIVYVLKNSLDFFQIVILLFLVQCVARLGWSLIRGRL